MFASVDVTSLLVFLNSLVPALGAIDPAAAGLGAVILFVVQRLGGNKFDLWGTLKLVLSKFAPTKGVPPVGPVNDLAAHEVEVVKNFIDKVRALREEKPVVTVAEKVEELKAKL